MFTLVEPEQRQKCTSRREPGCAYIGFLSGKNIANLKKNSPDKNNEEKGKMQKKCKQILKTVDRTSEDYSYRDALKVGLTYNAFHQNTLFIKRIKILILLNNFKEENDVLLFRINCKKAYKEHYYQ